MSSIKSDGQGFLVGERVATPRQQDSASGLKLLHSMKTDVGVIRHLLEAQIAQRFKVSGASSRRATVVAGERRGSGASMAVGRDSRGRFVGGARPGQVVQPVGRGAAPAVATPSGRVGGGSSPSAADRSGQSGGRVSVGGGDPGGRSGERDSRGRFAGSGDGGQSSDRADGGGIMGRIAGALEGIGDSMSNADQIDPTIAAMKEVRDVVSPIGRGVMSLGQRMAERKKERWYGRILKAITGKKNTADGNGGGGESAVRRGSFFGTMLGELGGKFLGAAGGVMGILGTLLTRIFAPVAAAWAAWEVGQWLGKKIYDWLTESGLMAKFFDAIDSFGDWFKEKRKLVEDAVKPVVVAVAKKAEAAKADVAERTSRNISSGTMNNWDRAKKHLVSASDQAGVDPGIVAKIANFESGFNQNARPRRKDGTLMSSAHGYGQLLDGTWTDMLNKYGAKYGVQGAGGLNKAQAAKLRDDPKLQAAMLAELTRENVTLGRKLGGKNDDANVYALHNLGGGDGSKFLKALKSTPDAPVSSVLGGKVISNNPALYGNGSVSVADAYKKMGSKMADGNRFALEVSSVSSAATVPVLSSPGPSASVVSPSFIPIRSASVPMPVPDRMPSFQVPNIPERLSTGGRAQTSVVIRGEVGQDVGDRTIAHVVTGGLGGAKH